jgi:ferredoxin
MKIVVNRDRCEANGRCMKMAPEVFSVDEQDQMHVLIEQPGPDLQARVEKAVRACPRAALSLEE